MHQGARVARRAIIQNALFCITACCDTIKVNFVSVRTSVASDGSPRAVIARKWRVRDRTSANEPTPARVVRGRRRMRGRLRLLYSVCLSTFFPPGLDKCHPLWYNADRLYGMVTPSSAILAHAASIYSGRASAVAQEQSSTTLVRWAFFVSSCKQHNRSSR